jgi:hypothetical protein
MNHRLTAMLVPPRAPAPVVVEIALAIPLGLVWFLQLTGGSTIAEFATQWTTLLILRTHPSSSYSLPC